MHPRTCHACNQPIEPLSGCVGRFDDALKHYHTACFMGVTATKPEPPSFHATCRRCGSQFFAGQAITLDQNGELAHAACCSEPIARMAREDESRPCVMCRKPITPGDEVVKGKNIFGGTIYSHKKCHTGMLAECQRDWERVTTRPKPSEAEPTPAQPEAVASPKVCDLVTEVKFHKIEAREEIQSLIREHAEATQAHGAGMVAALQRMSHNIRTAVEWCGCVTGSRCSGCGVGFCVDERCMRSDSGDKFHLGCFDAYTRAFARIVSIERLVEPEHYTPSQP